MADVPCCDKGAVPDDVPVLGSVVTKCWLPAKFTG